LASGPKNDEGFVQAHYEGLLAAQEACGIEVAVSENNTDPETRATSLANLAQDNDLVIVLSYLGDAGPEIASQFPDVDFVFLDGPLTPDVPNNHVYRFNQGEGAYVAGVIAAEITDSGTIGYIGAAEIPATVGSDAGFRYGAESVNPDIDYLSTYTGSFVDAAKAKEAASAQIAEGADVIYTFLDAAIDGVIAAVDESGADVSVFSITSPLCDESDAFIGTDVVTPAAVMLQLVEEGITGTLPTEVVEYGLEDPEIQQLEMCPSADPALQERADEVAEQIRSGEIELPDDVI